MQIAEVLRVAYRGSHDGVREAMDEIDPEWLFWQPEPGAAHAGFLLWHLLRDEDAIIQGELLGMPQVWTAGRWFERFALPPDEQGTGFGDAELTTMTFSLDDLRNYASAVWQATDGALAGVDDSRLLGPAWGGTMLELVLSGSVGHNWVHLGEVRTLMGRRGWRFRE